MSEEPPKRLRDHVGLIQNQFSELFELIWGTIAFIQRDAATDPTSPDAPPDLYSYDRIPESAKRIVEKVLVVDALLDEAETTTCLGRDREEIVRDLKREGDDYERSVAELVNIDRRAEQWLERVSKLSGLVAGASLGIEEVEEEEEEEEDVE